MPTTRLHIKLGSRLRYDFPRKRQLWEYSDVDDPSNTVIFAELWINFTLYELDFSTNPPRCDANPFQLEVLRPDWLVHTKYISSHYLDRQPPPPNKTAGGVCYNPYSELSDLFQDPAPIGGMTNSAPMVVKPVSPPVPCSLPADTTPGQRSTMPSRLY